MKNLLCVILILALSFTLAACASPKEDIKDPVSFYYRQLEMDYGNAPSAIAKEIRDAQSRRQDYSYLLSLYFKGPEEYSLYNPFPRSTTVKSFALQDGAVDLQLSSAFASLSGLDLSIACACLTITVCEMTGAEQVTISAADSLLDGNPKITMSLKDLLLSDDSNIVIDPE